MTTITQSQGNPARTAEQPTLRSSSARPSQPRLRRLSQHIDFSIAFSLMNSKTRRKQFRATLPIRRSMDRNDENSTQVHGVSSWTHFKIDGRSLLQLSSSRKCERAMTWR
jgi:hypothetical protein